MHTLLCTRMSFSMYIYPPFFFKYHLQGPLNSSISNVLGKLKAKQTIVIKFYFEIHYQNSLNIVVITYEMYIFDIIFVGLKFFISGSLFFTV